MIGEIVWRCPIVVAAGSVNSRRLLTEKYAPSVDANSNQTLQVQSAVNALLFLGTDDGADINECTDDYQTTRTYYSTTHKRRTYRASARTADSREAYSSPLKTQVRSREYQIMARSSGPEIDTEISELRQRS